MKAKILLIGLIMGLISFSVNATPPPPPPHATVINKTEVNMKRVSQIIAKYYADEAIVDIISERTDMGLGDKICVQFYDHKVLFSFMNEVNTSEKVDLDYIPNCGSGF